MLVDHLFFRTHSLAALETKIKKIKNNCTLNNFSIILQGASGKKGPNGKDGSIGPKV